MSNPFVAEIRIFTGNFAPKGWAQCDGQTLPLSQNTALFSLLGTTYGGDGKSNFKLPNLQGCAPLQAGQGPGLSQRDLGETGGEQAVTLLQSEMAAHPHGATGSSNPADQLPATSNVWASGSQRGQVVYSDAGAASQAPMSPQALSVTGGGQPHNNMPPYLGLTFIIALQGVFPARS
ncbi:MAG: phage tail protein [Actinomycetota bacterium]